MPRLNPDTIEDDQLYGVKEVENNMSMRERMSKRFKPHDTVQVMNIDDETLEWQWLAEDDETYTMDEDIKIVERQKPGLWRLGAGEKDVLEGACAYLMIECLFKKMAVKKVGLVEHPLDERDIKNFAFDDPEAQETFVDRVFVGRLSPHAMQAAAVAQLEGTKSASKPAKATQPAIQTN